MSSEARDAQALAEMITAAAERADISVATTQAQALAQHVVAVLVANETMNLTRVTDPGDAVTLHVIDSLTALSAVLESPPGPLVDIGTGAGYPGIPIAIMVDRHVTLVESVKKKARFLSEVLQGLALEADVAPERVEEFATGHLGEFAVVSARAVSSLASLVELASPLLFVGGRLIAYKGAPGPEEIERGDSAARRAGMRRMARVPVVLPGSPVARELVIYERYGMPSVRLPRRSGLAQTSPL